MTHSFWWLIVDALAVYRLTILVTMDEIFRPYREEIFKGFGPSSSYTYFVTCPWCVSFWFAILAVVLTEVIPGQWAYAAVVLALSSVTGFLAERTDH